MIGNDLLGLALSAIGSQTVTYLEFDDNTVNNVGMLIPSYKEGILMDGSFQPVPKEMYEVNGLDFTQHWFVFYTSNNLLEVERDTSSDRIQYNGKTYQVKDKNDWFDYNGWVGVLCVRL